MLNDAVTAAKAKEVAYELGDSGQLYLYVTPAGGRHWIVQPDVWKLPRGMITHSGIPI